MASNSWHLLEINDDPTAELHYWKSQLLVAVCSASGFVVAAVVAIAFWPPDSGNPELRAFVRQFWSVFIECALWLGFLLGLLWGAARRLGCGLAGSLPWQPPDQLSRRAVIIRFCGQTAVCFALAAVLLAVAGQLALLADQATAPPVFGWLAAMAPACLGVAALFTLATLAGRKPSRQSHRV